MHGRPKMDEIDADWVLKRLAAMADADLSELHNEDGTLRPIKDWPKIWRKVKSNPEENLKEIFPEDKLCIH
jgi:phage terminase small subunit